MWLNGLFSRTSGYNEAAFKTTGVEPSHEELINSWDDRWKEIELKREAAAMTWCDAMLKYMENDRLRFEQGYSLTPVRTRTKRIPTVNPKVTSKLKMKIKKGRKNK